MSESEYAPPDTLFGGIADDESTASVTNTIRVVSLPSAARLPDMYKRIFLSKFLSDFEITTYHGGPIPTHKVVLVANSTFFAEMLEDPESEEVKAGKVKFDDEPKDVMEIILKLLAGGVIAEDLFSYNCLDVYVTAVKFRMEELKEVARKSVISTITTRNFYQRLVFAKIYDDSEIFTATAVAMADNWKIVEGSDEYKDLVKTDPELCRKVLQEGMTYLSKKIEENNGV